MSELILSLGCAVCTTTALEFAVPHVMWLGLWAFVWFIATVAVCAHHDHRPPEVPGPVLSTLLCLTALVLGLLFLGPVLVLILGLIPLYVFLSAAWGVQRERAPADFRRAILLCGSVATLVGIGLIAWSLHTKQTRSTVDYMLARNSLLASRVGFRSLRKAEPDSLEDYRQLLRRAPDRCEFTAPVASRIGELGSREDEGLLLSVLRRLESDPDCSLDREADLEAVRSALEDLTDRDLPEGATADDWERALAAPTESPDT